MTNYITKNIIDVGTDTDPTTGLAFGTRTANILLNQPITFADNKKKAFRVIRCIMSPEIANIYQYNGFDNSKLRISKDGGGTWINIQLPNGNYSTLRMLQDAINDVADQFNWYLQSSDPGILINSNDATGYAYTLLDSSKLAVPGQLAIDYSLSSIYQLFGYTASTCTFLIDGIFTGSLPPAVDVQGTYANVFVSFINNTRWRNGKIDNTICKVPFVAENNAIEIIYPSTGTGTISPIVPCTISSYVQNINVRYVNPSGNDLIFLYGNCILELEIMEEP